MVVRELITLLGFKVDDSKLKSYENSIRAVTKTAAIAGTAILGIGGFAIKMAGDLEQAEVGFEVFLGSADKAKKMVKDLHEMADKTPYESKDLIAATEEMLNFGIAGKDILPTLSTLGDISMGNAEKLKGMTLAFSQMSSTGRLQGQDLEQMINAGFNPLLQMAAGNDWDNVNPAKMAALRKQMEQGQISAEMVKKAFKDATSEGGHFYMMMDKMGKTFQGRWSTFKDAIHNIGTEIGTRLLPYGKDILEVFTDFFGAHRELIIKSFVKLFTAVAYAIGYLIVGLRMVVHYFGGLDNIAKNVWGTLKIIGGIIWWIITALWSWKAVIGFVAAGLIALRIHAMALVAVGMISKLITFVRLWADLPKIMYAITAAMRANPIGAIITAATALAFIIYEIYKHWDAIVQTIKEAWAWTMKITGIGGNPEEDRKAAAEQIKAQSAGKKAGVVNSNKSNSAVINNVTVNAELPPGTSKDHAEILKKVVNDHVDEKLQSAYRQTKGANPKG